MRRAKIEVGIARGDLTRPLDCSKLGAAFRELLSMRLTGRRVGVGEVSHRRKQRRQVSRTDMEANDLRNRTIRWCKAIRLMTRRDRKR